MTYNFHCGGDVLRHDNERRALRFDVLGWAKSLKDNITWLCTMAMSRLLNTPHLKGEWTRRARLCREMEPMPLLTIVRACRLEPRSFSTYCSISSLPWERGWIFAYQRPLHGLPVVRAYLQLFLERLLCTVPSAAWVLFIAI